MKPMRVLWIAPRWPLPPDDGSRRATYNLVSRLPSRDLEVDFLALIPPGVDVTDADQARREMSVRRVFIIRRSPRSLRSLGRSVRDPITYAPFHAPEVLRSWSAIAETEKWDGYVFDGLHAAALFSQNGLYVPPKNVRFTVHRSHNVEARLWHQEAERSSWIKRWPLKWQEGLVERFERSVLRGVDLNFTISLEDMALYRNLEPTSRLENLPVGFDFSSADQMRNLDFERKPRADARELRLLFVGRLDWPPNRSGLEWFLREVWPVAQKLRSEMSLSIVGSGSSGWLERYLSLPGVRFHGRVPNVEPFYEDSDLTVIPVFYGSGVRVKALETCYYGRACLSTAIGVGGTGLQAGENYIRAETADEWIQALVGVDREDLERLGPACHVYLRENYDAMTIAARFRSSLLSL